MSDGVLFPPPRAEGVRVRWRPQWAAIRRRGPILRPSRSADPDAGVFGIDLTAGCGHGCPFCHIRGSRWFPGEGRVLYDPTVSDRLEEVLDGLDRPPRLVVLSPTSDPLPAHPEVRAEARRVLTILLDRRIDVVLMTRGRISTGLVDRLAEDAGRVRVASALMTLDRGLGRLLEPGCAPPKVRLRAIAALIEAGVPVEVRLEPLIAGLTDTRENVKPLFEALARAGARRVIAHHLFWHPAMTEPLREAIRPLGLGEKLDDDYDGGPVFSIGTLGATKHLPLDARRAGLASLAAWGAEHGLIVETGATQNPDLRRAEASPPPKPEADGSSRRPSGEATSPRPAALAVGSDSA